MVLSWMPSRLYIYFKSQLNEWTLYTVAWIRDISILSQVLRTHYGDEPCESPKTFLRDVLSFPRPSPSTGQWSLRGTLPSDSPWLPPLVVSAFLFELLSLLPFALWVLLVFLAWFGADHLTLGTSRLPAAQRSDCSLQDGSSSLLKAMRELYQLSRCDQLMDANRFTLVVFLNKQKKKKIYFCEERSAYSSLFLGRNLLLF